MSITDGGQSEKGQTNMNVTFTSVWDGGSLVKTPASYNPETHLIEVDSPVDFDPDGSLTMEYITLPDGTDLDVCTECHEYTLKTVMKEGVGKQLHEVKECPNCSIN